MGRAASSDITRLLAAWSAGDRAAADPLLSAVYAELKRLARYQLARDRGQTLQPTALVHEAYMKLVDQRSVGWQNRAHFFAIAARLMRRIVLKTARRKGTQKRGGGIGHLQIDDAVIPAAERASELIALDDALTRLAALDARQSEIVELRYFGGLDVDETAAALGISAGTVKREWRSARAWLHKEMTRSSADDA